MLINCTILMEGPGPSESVVSIKTADGKAEEVIVYRGLLSESRLDIGPVVRFDAGRALIELPRESASGRWRLWVPEGELKPLQAA